MPTRISFFRATLLIILLCGCSGRTKDAPDPTSETQTSTSADVALESAKASTSKLQAALQLNKQGQSASALKIVQEVLIESPDDTQALGVAVEIHVSLRQYCEAADLATKIADTGDPTAAAILVRAFDFHLRCADYAAAEADLKRALQLAPDNNINAHRLLAQVLNAQGRRQEASQHVRQLIRMRVALPNELLSLIDLSGPFNLASFDELVDKNKISLFSLGEARHLYVGFRTEPEKVISLLERVTKEFPGNTTAAAFYGRVLAENSQLNDLQVWLDQLPPGIQREPEYWHAIGTWLLNQDRHEEAIRAFGESVRRDPTSRASLRSMIDALEFLGAEQRASSARKRLADLDQIFRIAKDADAEQATWISEKLQDLTRPWESAAWLRHSAQISGQLQQVVPQLNQRHLAIVAWEKEGTADQIRDARLRRMLGFKITDYALPDIASSTRAVSQSVVGDLSKGLQFDDVADHSGINVYTHSGFPIDGGHFSAHQVNGSGLAAFDYDMDGRCDLYLMQCGGKPDDPLGSPANQLFRQSPDGQFGETTEPSGSGDRGFGQGVCAGDVNQDGFPDLLLANIGANALYLNQGDGTFRDASDLIAANRRSWTSSLGLGDLDGDHLPEIVEINYIDDPDAFGLKCKKNYMDCNPVQFDAAADRVYRCLADGKFTLWQSVTDRMNETPKQGMGLIIANFDRQQGNDLFITNDGDLNHYWHSVAADSGVANFEMVESGNVRGCSIGRMGNSQACMGVAAGDFVRNGTLDLHVTNFHNESVNLYVQTRTGFFSDEALKYGLTKPSFPTLGFGTQAADFDHDGWLDLAVLAGHVFDGRFEGLPFKMLPQMYRGSRQGFALHDQDSIGSYWQQKQLGRTMATFDWNRDGRIDLIANHLDLPVALLQNNSSSGNWLQLELVGVTSERDAIGAEVHAETGEDSWTSWQTGGDGYMCSNEPVIHFGLGTHESIDRLEVRWPSGKIQTFNNLKPNTRYLIVEGEEGLYER